jgi:phosphatidylserine decarboxylase
VLREALAPIHSDGWRFIAIFVVVAGFFCWLWHPLGWVGLIAIAWCVYFFRDLWRVTPLRAGLVVAPADGRIVAIDQAPPPPELEMGENPMLRVGIFLNIFDVHVNRMPMGGEVKRRVYRAGKFLNASLDKASADNERMAIRLASDGGADIAVVQIAGLVARRIVCKAEPGQQVIAGERFGLIRFGSRTDLYLPPSWTPLVLVGQRAVGGETVIADARASEPPRRGTEH